MNDIELLEATYFDSCTVKRLQKIKNPNTGITETVEKIIYEDVKCAISKNDNQTISEVDGVGKLSYTHKLFLSPNYEILEGDTILVTSIGKIFSYLASKSYFYPSHSETILTFKDRV